ncbi:MAG TPA: hypothetical protein VLA62_14065 [Solirubrobacterales bacterium]|nr:hypothetical protein [Solirubrobacterales bacterium]
MEAARSRPAGAPGLPGLAEAAALWWREETSERTLRRDGRRWTAWTAWVVLAFTTPGIVLIVLSLLTLPVALGCFAHAWIVPWLQARRGGRSVVPLGGERAEGSLSAAHSQAESVALGLLGDLLDHDERELLRRSGLALERGELGTWLVGERGALMVRRGGRRVDCWCVRVAEQDELPGGDRVAHLLLALREDERGFAKVANLGFSGAAWRVRRGMPERSRSALDVARTASRGRPVERPR